MSKLDALLDAEFAAPIAETVAPPSAQAVDPVGARPKIPNAPTQTLDPRAAAFYKGLDAPISGTGQFLAKTGEALTSLGGIAPNPVSEGLGGLGSRIAAHRGEVEKAATVMGGNAHPMYNLAGEAGSAPSLVAGAVKAPIMALGALGGAMAPSKDEGYWGNKAVDIGAGSLIAPVVQGVAGTIASALAPKVQAAMQYLKSKGMEVSNTTIGQLLGGKVQDFENFLRDVVPFSGIGAKQAAGTEEWRQAPVREALKKVGLDLPEGMTTQEAMGHIQKVTGDIYDTVVPQIKEVPFNIVTLKSGAPSFNQGFLGTLRNQAVDAAMDIGDQKMVNQLNGLYKNRVLPTLNIDPKTGTWTGQLPSGTAIHELTKDLSKEYSRYKGTGGSNEAYADAVYTLRKTLQDKLRAADSTGKLAKVDAAFSDLQIPQAAAAASTKISGEFTPAQLMQQVNKATSDKTLARGAGKYQGYASEGQKVFGQPETSTGGKLTEYAGALIPPAAAALMGHPLVAAGMAAGAIPITRAAYSKPVQGALSWYANKEAGPLRQGAADILREAPRFGAGATNSPLDVLRNVVRPPSRTEQQ